MAYEDLKELIDHLDQSSVSYIDYFKDGEHMVLSKETPQWTARPAEEDLQEEEADRPSKEIASVSEGKSIDAPMVGVAYLQAKPGEEPYVQVGDHVSKGQVVMIIEAMKLMNDIQADCSGRVLEILVDNEEVVEYGQALIRIQPDEDAVQ